LNPLDAGVDVVAAGLSLALVYYSAMLLRIFRGGIMEESCRVLASSTVFLFVALAIEVLDNLFPGINPFGLVSDTLTMVFILVLLYGFYLLRTTWTVKVPRKPALAKGMPPVSGPSK
jgi:hypothetical protein